MSCVRCWKADSGSSPLCLRCEAEVEAELDHPELAEEVEPVSAVPGPSPDAKSAPARGRIDASQPSRGQ